MLFNNHSHTIKWKSNQWNLKHITVPMPLATLLFTVNWKGRLLELRTGIVIGWFLHFCLQLRLWAFHLIINNGVIGGIWFFRVWFFDFHWVQSPLTTPTLLLVKTSLIKNNFGVAVIQLTSVEHSIPKKKKTTTTVTDLQFEICVYCNPLVCWLQWSYLWYCKWWLTLINFIYTFSDQDLLLYMNCIII